MLEEARNKPRSRKLIHMVKHVKIRKGVWETNSSSSHSLSIADDSKPFIMDTSLLPDQHGKIRLTGGEFGWEWAKYNDAETKANYLAVFCADQDDFKERLINVIKQQTGCTEVDFLFSKDYTKSNWSYIDHQALEDATPNGAFETDETLRNFIFNRNSWLFTGNDNSSPANDFHDVPVFEQNRVVMPEYKYELFVDGLEKRSVKFKHEPTYKEIEDAINHLVSGVEYIGNINADGGHFDQDGGIHAQILRSGMDNVFTIDYNVNIIDFDKKTFGMKKRDLYNEALGIYDRDFKGSIPWNKGGYERVRAIESELIASDDVRYVRHIGYKIVPL